MNWEKLKPNHYFKEPIEHIYTSTIFDIKEYDKLYENQNDLSHKVWQEFDRKYRIGFEFHDDLKDFDTQKDIICLWFFKERNDRSAGQDIKINGKIIKYFPNTFLMTASKNVKIIENKDGYIRRPLIQLDMTKQKYEDIVKRFR